MCAYRSYRRRIVYRVGLCIGMRWVAYAYSTSISATRTRTVLNSHWLSSLISPVVLWACGLSLVGGGIRFHYRLSYTCCLHVISVSDYYDFQFISLFHSRTYLNTGTCTVGSFLHVLHINMPWANEQPRLLIIKVRSFNRSSTGFGRVGKFLCIQVSQMIEISLTQ